MCQQKVFSPVFPEVCIQKERGIFSPDHEMLLLPPFHSNYAACDNIPVYGNPDIPVFLPDDRGCVPVCHIKNPIPPNVPA